MVRTSPPAGAVVQMLTTQNQLVICGMLRLIPENIILKQENRTITASLVILHKWSGSLVPSLDVLKHIERNFFEIYFLFQFFLFFKLILKCYISSENRYGVVVCRYHKRGNYRGAYVQNIGAFKETFSV